MVVYLGLSLEWSCLRKQNQIPLGYLSLKFWAIYHGMKEKSAKSRYELCQMSLEIT